MFKNGIYYRNNVKTVSLQTEIKVIIMVENRMLNYVKAVVQNMPAAWLKLTTHRLDIYDESLAKKMFLEQFETLFNAV